jgi:multisubunit Na+/H+ antiporter MnhB subunit
MVGGLVATIILTVLIFGEAPQLQGSPGNLEIVIVFMGGAAVAASNALWHGWRTSREHAA